MWLRGCKRSVSLFLILIKRLILVLIKSGGVDKKCDLDFDRKWVIKIDEK